MGTDLATSPPTEWATTVTPVVDVTLHASFLLGGGKEDCRRGRGYDAIEERSKEALH